MDIETLLVRADDEADAALSPAIAMATAAAAQSAEAFGDMSQTPRHEGFYRRYGHPTQGRLERVVAQIENAEAALAASSGMGAISTTVLSLVASGDHVVAQQSMYGGTLALLQTMLPRLGVEVTLVDQTDVAAFAHAMTPRTKLVMLETPSNPLLQLTDLAAVAKLARGRGATTLADNTVATPIHQRPHELGIDLVVHSATKALSGHSDALAGIVLGRRDLVEHIWKTHIILGAAVSPLDAWLVLRGLRTLEMRARRQCETALALARFLEAHPAVARTRYPGLASHPQHELAARQMSGFGSLVSFELRGGVDAAESLLSEVKLPRRSASLGSAHTLIVRPAAMWGLDLSGEGIERAGLPPGLVRVAAGLESAADLIADFDAALARL